MHLQRKQKQQQAVNHSGAERQLSPDDRKSFEMPAWREKHVTFDLPFHNSVDSQRMFHSEIHHSMGFSRNEASEEASVLMCLLSWWSRSAGKHIKTNVLTDRFSRGPDAFHSHVENDIYSIWKNGSGQNFSSFCPLNHSA